MIRKFDLGCAVANTPDCSDSVKEITIFTAANSLPVAKQITGWRCRACEIHNRSNRHAIARGLLYRSKVSGIGAGCSVADGEAAHVERGPHSAGAIARSEEHTSELQSLMRISYAVYCLKQNKQYVDI